MCREHLRERHTTLAPQHAGHRSRAREEVGRKGWRGHNSWLYGSPTASSSRDYDAADLDTPDVDGAAAVKINKTQNKLRIDFVFIFDFCTLRLRTSYLYDDTLLDTCQNILHSQFLPHSTFYRGRRRHEYCNRDFLRKSHQIPLDFPPATDTTLKIYESHENLKKENMHLPVETKQI